MKIPLLLIPIFILASSCSKPSNELEAISQDVLKQKQGIDIQIKPIPKSKDIDDSYKNKSKK